MMAENSMTQAEGASPPPRQVRALFDDSTITVYQAYSPSIARPAIEAGTLVAPFSRERMTWIKPSFLWMMYRCGWATKPGQEHVLAIRISRSGFEAALAQACLSHFEADVHGSPEEWLRRKESSSVRVQWDPERRPDFQPLPWRSLQVGLAGAAVHSYVSEWIVDLDDITSRVHQLYELHRSGTGKLTAGDLPDERPYALPETIRKNLGMNLDQQDQAVVERRSTAPGNEPIRVRLSVSNPDA